MRKKELIERVKELEEKIDENRRKESEIKDDLARFLGLYPPSDFGHGGWITNVKWSDIFYAIGELKADANYSVVLGVNKELLEENKKLKKEIQDMYFKD